MKKIVGLYQVQVVWNREFDFTNYSTPEQEFDRAKSKAEDILNSGDGARVKKYRIVNHEGEVAFPFKALSSLEIARGFYPKSYTCNFCGKEETGKPFDYLTNPSPQSQHEIPLRPVGWDFKYVEPCKSDKVSWSCGCHRFSK